MSESRESRLERARSGKLSRRDFLGRAGVGAFFVATGACVIGSVRALVPYATPDPSQKFKLGPPSDYPPGTVRNFEDQNAIVFRDDEGVYAISTVCTHLGCIVSYNKDKGFDCPCHGSTFQSDGRVRKGPAPTPLPWLEVSMLPNGQLAADNARKVPMGTKLAL